MVAPIVNPEIPYNGEIPGGMQAGKMCRIQGVTLPEADRFNINLQVGPNDSPRDDTALHISVRLNQGYIARNSLSNGDWGEEKGDGTLPIGHAQSWEIIILVDHKDYKIAVNGQHFCEFPHRIPISQVSHLLIDGQVSITLISWEGITGVSGSENQSKASQVNAEGPGVPQGGYGAPPHGGPQPGYGPVGGYGMPPQGYGPPVPPGAQPESGFDSFLDSAQSMLAGAIKSGAAEKLLGGLLSSGGNQQGQQGYAHQNAQYGIYPDLPKDLDPNIQDKKQAPGPVESLLSGLLSGGNKQSAQPGVQPQTTQQQGVDFGSLLSGFLSGNQHPQQPDAVPPTRRNYQDVPTNPQNQGVDLGSLLGGLLSGGKQQQQGQQGNAQQNAHGNTPHQGVDFGALLGGLLSGGAQQQGQRPPEHQGAAYQNVPVNSGNTQHAQNQGVDFGSLLGGLLSGGKQQQGQESASQPGGTNQNAPGNTQHQGVDYGSLLGGLLSGGSQQGHVPPPQQGSTQHSQQNVPGNTQHQGIDFGSLLGGLLSGGSQQGQVQPQHNLDTQNQGNAPGGQHSQGVDFGSLLGGLLGPQQKQQPGQAPGNAQQHNVDVGALLTGLMSHIQTRPIQETNPSVNTTTPQVPPTQQSRGQGSLDLNSLLNGLLSGGGQGNQASSGQQPPVSGQTAQIGGGYHNATGGFNNANDRQQGTGGFQAPTSGKPKEAPKQSQGDYEDVTDQLAQIIAQEGGKRT